jgi:hypothetical protein
VRELDVNVFVDPLQAQTVIAALPRQLRGRAGPSAAAVALRDGQLRLAWGSVPLDIFFSVLDFHHRVRAEASAVRFGEGRLPIVDPLTLAVFKARYGRPKDRVDVEALMAACELDPAELGRWLERIGPAPDVGSPRGG